MIHSAMFATAHIADRCVPQSFQNDYLASQQYTYSLQVTLLYMMKADAE